MKINRNNYELYFIDYLDGNLSDRDILMLEDFLLINPDLREELEGTEKIQLSPENIEYYNKELLKKTDLNLPVSDYNFEDFCVAEIEGDLNDLQKKALTDFSGAHPELGKIRALFLRLHLVPDKKIIFPGKEKLKKSVFLIPREMLAPILSVAAAITIMLILFSSNENVKEHLPGMTADLPSSIYSIPKAVIPADSSKTPEKRIQPTIQNASIIAFSSPKEKKQTKTIKKGDPLEKNNDETKSKSGLPPQRLNPSFQIKLPSVADNQVLVPAIERGKIIYSVSESRDPAPPEYLSLSEYARKQLSEKILGSKERANTRITAWQIADAGLNGLNKITGSDMKLEKRTAVDGSITAYSFNSKLLSFSTTSVK